MSERPDHRKPLANHWRSLADRWRLQESPGRPCAEDIGFYEEAVARWHEGSRAASPLVLVLGVTPEIALMRWPAGARVLAIDQSRAMIEAVWPGAKLGFSAACAGWTELPLPAESGDVAIGDGCFSSLSSAAYGAMTRSVRRVLRPDGLFVMRFSAVPRNPNLMALIRHFSAARERPARLREVRTIGETVTAHLRATCREAWGVPITDCYSSQEIGYIAIQCPESEQYHVTAESVLIEILAGDGTPCRPGEIGRLVVTSLHNFAMPLIRYDLRDYAEAAAPCPCGRGLPALSRIVGRSRNILTLPNGQRRYPLVGFHEYREIAPIRQYQLIQHSLEEIEVRFVVDRPLMADEEARLGRVIQSALGHPFRLTFTYFTGEIPRGPGGKFEEFVSKVET